MMSLFWKPYSLFVFMMLVFGMVLSLSSENWLAIWIGLEINLYSFIPLILVSGKNQEKEAAVKYFISQSIPSAFVVVSFVSHSSDLSLMSFMFFIAMLMKMGMAPLHYWVASVMSSISWVMCWVLATIQKVVPMLLVFYSVLCPSVMVVYAAGLSSLVGGIGGLNQTMLRAILAYSSIGHMGWMLAASLCCKSSALFYLFTYILVVSALIFFLDLASASSGNFSMKLSSLSWFSVVVILLFFSLGGLPPFFGFYAKMFVLAGLSESNFFLLSFFLILGSVLNLYYYMKIVFIMVMSSPAKIFSMVGSFSSIWIIVLAVVAVYSVGGMLVVISLL